MFKKYNFQLILIFIVFLSLNKLEAKLNKSLNKTLISPTFKQVDLTKRPLNFYIIANGKHAKVLNKSLPSSENNVNKIVDYKISRPPFLIKNRGSVILLNENSLNWHFGYPSLLQMLAASGHTTVAIEGSNIDQIKEVINWEELHNILILADEKKKKNKKIGKNNIHWISLKKEIKEEFKEENLKEINFEWEPKNKEKIEKLTQITVNLLDFIHPLFNLVKGTLISSES
ncbi:hypothetical protein Mgra_00008339 [Meloidogyne graminicola]|uniref:Fe/B12 periplasmic-binding domain-containing protein n=1 Tax=Meloidogyne graminicola TaxID=189291 RepID=A0A8S9ZG74_9BILA|nr:hypothetical protein Mgra_00008339 [Meloidogyne graminicola]